MAFKITLLAGLATMIGIFPIYINFNNNKRLIDLACAFASGVMISLSILDLIPEGINCFNKDYHGIILFIYVISFILLGMVVELFLDKMVDKYQDNKIYSLGILSMLVIIIHNIPEGMITYIVSNMNTKVGIFLGISIALHNIPEGVSIALPIYIATGKKKYAVLYTFISAISEPLGAFISYIFIRNGITNNIMGILYCFIAGMMIMISLKKFIPSIKDYDITILLFMIIGVMMIIGSLWLNYLFF